MSREEVIHAWLGQLEILDERIHRVSAQLGYTNRRIRRLNKTVAKLNARYLELDDDSGIVAHVTIENLLKEALTELADAKALAKEHNDQLTRMLGEQTLLRTEGPRAVAA